MQFHLFFVLFGLYPSGWVSVTVAVIIALAVAAPSAPGFIGVYQTACLASFVLFGMTREMGVGFSIIAHVYQYILFVSYGLYVLMRDGLKLSELRERSP